MRMIGIGLLGFLLAGIALLLSTMNILEQGQRFVREFASGSQLVFEHRKATTEQSLHRAVVQRTNPDHPLILSGLPAYQSVSFTLPVDARPTSGYLQIDATSQVLDGVEGVLRISIQNTRRGEMLLRSGEAGRSLQIPLSPMDFAGDQLVVSFSLQGTGPHRPCRPEDGVEAIVEIETTSAIYLTLDRPLQSTRDRVHAWGNVVRVAWPQWLQQEEQTRRLVLATQFQRRSLGTFFDTGQSDDALTTIGLRDALTLFPPREPELAITSNLFGTGANAGMRRFHRSTVWRKRYALAGGTGQPMPEQLDLQMLFGRLIEPQYWALTVTLNNRLVFQGHITGKETEYNALIDLPREVQAVTNALEVAVTSTAPHGNVCDDGPELVAEMLPASRLIAGNAVFTDPLSKLKDALSEIDQISVTMTGRLTALDADVISQMLNKVIPLNSEFKPARSKAHVTVLSQDHQAPALPVTGPAWVVTHDNALAGLSVQKIEPGDALPRTGLALLVTPNATLLSEAGG
ncbi:cellulose biosynthesis cyclic di-GMP-binding regulatory protein BcsB [Roseobacter sp.]|uniref:cellulose biosynthesis cyclic di-GMP-binding regulatory protein BcsB n=1 Tax=Roseobacter sp. TaxID=1907202 RepID=UPI00385C5BE8